MTPTVIALIICIAAAALEGVLAGGRVRQRLNELQMPRYTPPFSIWLLIGIVYYAICFIVLRHLLAIRPQTFWSLLSLSLLASILLTNAFWNFLFFRRRNLMASFIAFVPYAGLVVALVISLIRAYPLGASLFTCYCLYLLYAAFWSYRLWRLNPRP